MGLTSTAVDGPVGVVVVLLEKWGPYQYQLGRGINKMWGGKASLNLCPYFSSRRSHSKFFSRVSSAS
jgi:hypothetical protein